MLELSFSSLDVDEDVSHQCLKIIALHHGMASTSIRGWGSSSQFVMMMREEEVQTCPCVIPCIHAYVWYLMYYVSSQ